MVQGKPRPLSECSEGGLPTWVKGSAKWLTEQPKILSGRRQGSRSLVNRSRKRRVWNICRPAQTCQLRGCEGITVLPCVVWKCPPEVGPWEAVHPRAGKN